MALLNHDFLLSSEIATRLYHEVASHLPIYDYHCHLSAADLSENRRYDNLHELWLAGDHYKWRAMRAAGVEEHFITGAADPFEKFQAWARTVPLTLRNPLYVWTHLELRRYFQIELRLCPRTAREIWQEANRQLGELDTQTVLQRFRVALIGTTDDPSDDLRHHQRLRTLALPTRVYPSFRPDRYLNLTGGDGQAGLERLERAQGCTCQTFGDFLQALERAHDRFHSAGCRVSDHGLMALPHGESSASEAERIFQQVRGGQQVPARDAATFTHFLIRFFGRLDATSEWTQQLHLGAFRNVNSRLFRDVGPDAGGDSIGDARQGPGLAQFLDDLDREDLLPRTILYNLNPADNYLFASMAGNFQRGPTPGKIQWGSGWWFLDQADGIRWQLDALSRLGLLGCFVGMLTDSRSLMSYPRHEYFRRVLCNMLGDDVARGEIPDDWDILSDVVSRICFRNARDYFGLELSETYA